MSRSTMHKIWEALPEMRKFKPTCFQIRYQGIRSFNYFFTFHVRASHSEAFPRAAEASTFSLIQTSFQHFTNMALLRRKGHVVTGQLSFRGSCLLTTFYGQV